MDLDLLRFANFAKLGDAITDWSDMAKQLDTIKRDADTNLKGKAHKAKWAGDNATVTRDFIDKTAGEFGDAHTQATTVHNILSDTFNELKGYQDQLKTAIDEGLKKNLTVMDTGGGGFTVTMNVHPDRSSNPDKLPDHTQADVDTLRDRVQQILKDATTSVMEQVAYIYGGEDGPKMLHEHPELGDSLADDAAYPRHQLQHVGRRRLGPRRRQLPVTVCGQRPPGELRQRRRPQLPERRRAERGISQDRDERPAHLHPEPAGAEPAHGPGLLRPCQGRPAHGGGDPWRAGPLPRRTGRDRPRCGGGRLQEGRPQGGLGQVGRRRGHRRRCGPDPRRTGRGRGTHPDRGGTVGSAASEFINGGIDNVADGYHKDPGQDAQMSRNEFYSNGATTLGQDYEYYFKGYDKQADYDNFPQQMKTMYESTGSDESQHHGRLPYRKTEKAEDTVAIPAPRTRRHGYGRSGRRALLATVTLVVLSGVSACSDGKDKEPEAAEPGEPDLRRQPGQGCRRGAETPGRRPGLVPGAERKDIPGPAQRVRRQQGGGASPRRCATAQQVQRLRTGQ